MATHKVGTNGVVQNTMPPSGVGTTTQIKIPKPPPQPTQASSLVGRQGPLNVAGNSSAIQAKQVGAKIFGQRIEPEPGSAHQSQLPEGFSITPKKPLKEDYLAQGEQVQVSFHTQVKSDGNDKYRTVELQKKDKDGEKVADTDRQEKVTQKFCEIKEKLHLGKTPISYSVTHHLLEVFRDGQVEVYDLFDEKDVKRLLEANGSMVDPNVKTKKSVFFVTLLSNFLILIRVGVPYIGRPSAPKSSARPALCEFLPLLVLF